MTLGFLIYRIQLVPKQLVNKRYLESEIAYIPTADLSGLLKTDGSQSTTGNLDMGDNTIIGIKSSSQDNAALTVGGAKSVYLPLSGDRGMQGNLNMGGYAIRNIKPFVEDDSSQSAQNAQLNDVINFGYFHTQRGDLRRLINEVSSEALNRKKKTDPMGDNTDMANHIIIRLKEPRHLTVITQLMSTLSIRQSVTTSRRTEY